MTDCLLTDSHLHFDSFEQSGEVEAILQRAADAGVRRMVAVGGTPGANDLAFRLARRYAGRVFATAGLDRDEAGKTVDLAALRKLMNEPEVVAVGESGLDYHYAPETAPAQRVLLTRMLALASEFRAPAVLHSRDADEDTLAMLAEHRASWGGDHRRLGVLHCFTGSLDFARALLELGLYISFSGIVTFKNAAALREVAGIVPDDRLLIETDAPYLAPVPHRGKRNEPAYVARVADALAEIRHDTPGNIADITSRNAARLFNLEA